MSFRKDAIRLAISRQTRRVTSPTDPSSGKVLPVSAYFGCNTFGLDQIKENLPKESYDALLALVQRGQRLPKHVSDEVANAVKDWSMSQGVTHFCHWFQ